VRTRQLDGSKSDKADCLARKDSMDVAVPDPHNMAPFIGQLRGDSVFLQRVHAADRNQTRIGNSSRGSGSVVQ
jgi:hypothetical protein